ncbi:phosphopentomutase, partial [Striga asiatica]
MNNCSKASESSIYARLTEEERRTGGPLVYRQLRGKFARLAVLVDLTKPLRVSFMINGRLQRAYLRLTPTPYDSKANEPKTDRRKPFHALNPVRNAVYASPSCLTTHKDPLTRLLAHFRLRRFVMGRTE